MLQLIPQYPHFAHLHIRALVRNNRINIAKKNVWNIIKYDTT